MTAAQSGQPAEGVVALDGRHAGASPEQVAAVADTLARLSRSVERRRQQFLAAAKHDVEWSAHLLIHTIAKCGPLRAGALAEAVQSDPSTISRQVSALVKDGLIERQADPEDGRASLLVLTDKGRDIHADHLALRNQHFARMLDDWSERDCRRLVQLLTRFAERYDALEPEYLANAGPKSRLVAGREQESS